ncbi:2-dehydro-3-deoxy-phosphogluconate aldolase [Ananas comosus]|uniref:2-dehydro-3-deoxy-phosphogluconate aldolase n=1 Tax=Ananas comosus TaxID=4615 RepID=A0A199VCC6_ANACO|nr:2-dehydro-3-deoxy-phosphogluconate aldolase [Ananas comosus]
MALASLSLFSPPPPPPPPKTLTAIQNSGVIACLRAHDGKTAMDAASAALRGGISVLEIVMSTPGVLEVIKDLRKDHPSLTFGEILLELEGSEILYIPGVMTPTEVLLAYNAGAKIVKVYPVSLLGGEKYISALKKPFPHVPMVASQGVTTESIGRYIEAGASAVVLSDAIFDKGAMQQRSFDEIERLASCADDSDDEVSMTKNTMYPDI